MKRSLALVALALRLLSLAALAPAIPSAHAAPTTPAKPADLLADASLPAWDFVTATPTPLASIATLGADGTLAIVGKPVGYLATKISHENYQLHLEWRWPANAAKNSNSGVLLHITSGPAGGTAWPECFQMQLKLGRAGDMLPMSLARFTEKLSTAPDAKTPQLDRTPTSTEKPAGEWNICDITCRGDTIEVFINGVLQNRVTKCTPATGKIGLQLEGTPFAVRNVRLTPLSPAIGRDLQTPPAKPAGEKFE